MYVSCSLRGLVGDRIIVEGSMQLPVGSPLVVVGPNACLKSIVACCLASRVYCREAYEGSVCGRYTCPSSIEIECEEEVEQHEVVWVGPERVLAPYAPRLISVINHLLSMGEVRVVDELRRLLYWLSLLKILMQSSGAIARRVQSIFYEAQERIAREYLGTDQRIVWPLDLQLLPLKFVSMEESTVIEESSIMVVDTRTDSEILVESASFGIAALILRETLLGAAVRARVTRKPILFVAEEPEEEAHPYTQFALGYLISYLTYKLKPEAILTPVITTHSEYVLIGILVGAVDAGATPRDRPRVYYTDIHMEKDRATITLREWGPGALIPGFFTDAITIVASRFKAYEKLWSGESDDK